jgi:hypothetical protein
MGETRQQTDIETNPLTLSRIEQIERELNLWAASQWRASTLSRHSTVIHSIRFKGTPEFEGMVAIGPRSLSVAMQRRLLSRPVQGR